VAATHIASACLSSEKIGGAGCRQVADGLGGILAHHAHKLLFFAPQIERQELTLGHLGLEAANLLLNHMPCIHLRVELRIPRDALTVHLCATQSKARRYIAAQ
jgi:hypothetical protein